MKRQASEMDAEDVEVKTIVFCMQNERYGSATVEPKQSRICDEIKQSEIFFCAFKCETHGFNKQEAFRLPLDVTADDLRFFLTILKNFDKICSFANPIARCAVNFEHVVMLINWFGLSLKILDLLKTKLIPNLCFVYPVSALSAYRVVPQKSNIKDKWPIQNLPGCLLEESFSMAERVEYVCQNSGGHSISMPIEVMAKQIVSQILQMEMCFLDILQQSTCVLSGAAALKLGCSTANFTDRDNVKLFVLNSSHRHRVVSRFLECCKQTKRSVFVRSSMTQNPSILHAIGPIGQRHIQLVFTLAKTADDLIGRFAVYTTQAYYDGCFFHANVRAWHDWDKKICSENPAREMTGKQLYIMQQRGFTLSESQQKYVESSVSSCMKKKYEFGPPFLLPPPTPIEYQNAFLFQAHDLVPFDETNARTKDFKQHLQSFTIFDESWDLYPSVCSLGCKIDTKSDLCLEYEIDVANQYCLRMLEMDVTINEKGFISFSVLRGFQTCIDALMTQFTFNLSLEAPSVKTFNKGNSMLVMHELFAFYVDGVPCTLDTKKPAVYSKSTIEILPGRVQLTIDEQNHTKGTLLIKWFLCSLDSGKANTID